MNHQQITEARILDYLSESQEREARAHTDYSPTIRAATHSEALSAMSWFLRGEGDLGRAALRKLTPAQLAKAQLAAVLFINASGEIAEDLAIAEQMIGAAALPPDGPESAAIGALPPTMTRPVSFDTGSDDWVLDAMREMVVVDSPELPQTKRSLSEIYATGTPESDALVAATREMIAQPCAYCGKSDCDDRWQHDREDRGHEVTIWKAAKS